MLIRVADNSISMFVPEVCKAIIDEYLDEVFPAPSSKDGWKEIADEVHRQWNVLHACGTLDDKHDKDTPSFWI